MADYTQPTDVLKRVRFFDGQFLTDQDFVDEQHYHLDRERRLARAIGLLGIVDGLVVAAVAGSPFRLTVSPGSAVDQLGRHLVLTTTVTLTLPAESFARAQGIQVRLVYGEVSTDVATTGGRSARRFDETPIVAAVTGGAVAVAPAGAPTAWDSDGVLLARVSASDRGDLVVDPTPIPRAGLDPKGPFRASVGTTGNLAVGTREAANPNGWARVLDVVGDPHARLTVRTPTITGLLGAHQGVWSAPAGVLVGTESAHATSIVTAAVPRLTVLGAAGTTAGFVGVGVQAPRARLEVASSATDSVDILLGGRIKSTSNDGGLWVGDDRFVGGLEKDKVGLYAGNAWQLTVTKDGHVGIGTTAPQTNGAWTRTVDVLGSSASRLVVRNGATTPITGVVGAHPGGYGAAAGLVVGTESDHAMSVFTKGAARLTVTGGDTKTGGNVGIGTTAPAVRLDIVGSGGTAVDLQVNGRIRSSSNDGGVWVGAGDDRFVGGVETTKIGFYTNKAWRLAVTREGDVGIGTTTPTARLDVVGDAADVASRRPTLKVSGHVQVHAETGGLSFGDDWRRGFIGLLEKDTLGVVTAGKQRWFVTSAGNMGFGLPDRPLPADGQPGVTWGRTFDFSGAGGSAPGDSVRLGLVRGNRVNGVVALNTGSAYGASRGLVVGTEEGGEDLCLITNGQVRFGIDRVGDTYVHNALWITPASNWGADGSVNADLNARWWWSVGWNNFNTNSTNGSPRAAVLRSGPSRTPSDARLKERVVDLDGATGMVRRLRGVRFHWNETGRRYLTHPVEQIVSAGPEASPEENEAVWAQARAYAEAELSRPEVGIVAQEVEAVLPELVGADDDGIRSVDYTKLSAVLLQALKEQLDVVDALTGRVAALEAAR